MVSVEEVMIETTPGLVEAVPVPPTAARTHRGCDACPTMWDDAWVDLIVPDPIWAIISPNSPDGESGGYLCARCLTGRLVEHGLSDVPVRTFGKPFWLGLAGVGDTASPELRAALTPEGKPQ